MQVTYGKGFRLKPSPTVREKVNRLEAAMEQHPQADCPLRHYFAPGLYAREMKVPKGTVIVGAVHKREHLIVLSAGRIRLVTDGEPVEIAAPHTMTCMPEQKNAFIALEDSVWTNFFATDETDTDKLVELLTYSKADELIGGEKNKQLAANKAAQIGKD
jgi:hypothetical protein